jgi:DNA invertase Pin-like site-specific DNA recombinase
MAVSSSTRGLVLDGYVRVSKVGGREGERFISPAVQREQIAAWANARGHRLGQVFIELDESGARADRPLLTAAVARIEAGISDGLVVSKINRFGRSLLDGLSAIERVRVAGGTFFSVQDDMSTATDTGRLVLRIMLSMAEWELDHIRAGWEIARRYAVARGVHQGSTTPIGYRKRRSGRLQPDPVTAPVLAEVFRRRAAGESISRLARYLEQEGVRTSRGNPGWCYSTLKQVLRNRVYVGEVRSGRFVCEDAHPALVDAVTWELAQTPRQPASAVTRRPSLLAGIVRCAGCGRPLIAHRRGIEDKTTYSCLRHHAGGACPAPANIDSSLVDPYVEAAVMRLLSGRRCAPDGELRAAERTVLQTHGALSRYRDSDRVFALLGEEAFLEGLNVRVERAREAHLRLAAAQARTATHDLPSASEVRARWPAMDTDARRELLKQVVDCVFVERGHRRPEERVTVCAAGAGPANLPSRRDKYSRMQPFTAPPVLRAADDATPEWDPAVLRRRLRDFTRGQQEWPTAATFRRAGRAALYHQALYQGGEHYWAKQLGLAFTGRNATAMRWSEGRVRASLRIYLAEKDSWPLWSQFRRDGMHTLRTMIGRTGGSARWASELGLRFDQHPTSYWTPERIRAQLTEFCAGRAYFPSHREFNTANLGGMVAVMQRDDSVQRWATEFGLPRTPGGRRPTPGN